MHRQRLEQTALTLSRLNGIWSFTGQELSWRVPVLLRSSTVDDVGALLQTISAYGCLTYAVCEAIEEHGQPPRDWNWLFNNVGRALMFELPQTLSSYESAIFEKTYMKSFAEGFKGRESPSSPSP